MAALCFQVRHQRFASTANATMEMLQAVPTIFSDTPRRLIVKYILLIPNSAGAWTHQAQLPLPTKPNDNFRQS